MIIDIVIDTDELKQMVVNKIRSLIPDIEFDPGEVRIEVKTTQNFRAEWEIGLFKATIKVSR